jgi:hypothetical protein
MPGVAGARVEPRAGELVRTRVAEAEGEPAVRVVVMVSFEAVGSHGASLSGQ